MRRRMSTGSSMTCLEMMMPDVHRGARVCRARSAEKARKGPRGVWGRSGISRRRLTYSRFAGLFVDGETRTRTGDTTIFSPEIRPL